MEPKEHFLLCVADCDEFIEARLRLGEGAPNRLGGDDLTSSKLVKMISAVGT